MAKQKIEQLINRLSNEVEKADLDDSIVEKIREFEGRIEPYLGNNSNASSSSSLIDQAKSLEVAFAQRHPVAEGIMQEIISMLSKMGI